MAIKAVVEKLEDAAEGIRGFYKQDGGKFVLDVEPVKVGDKHYALEDVSGLKSSLGAERARAEENEKAAKEAARKLEIFADLGDPKDAKKALEQFAELRKIDPKKEADKLASERVELWTKDEGEKFKAEITARDTKIASLSGGLSKALIEGEAVKAILAAKGKVKPLLPHVLSQTRLRENEGEFVVEVVQMKDGKEIPRIGGSDGKPMTIAQLVDEIRQDSDFAGNFEGSRASGSGAQGSNGAAAGAGASNANAGKSSRDMIRAGLESHIAGR